MTQPVGRVPTVDQLDHEYRRLLEFGLHFAHPLGGAAYLDDVGRPDFRQPVQTYITARMAHVYSLAHLTGTVPTAGALADTALAGLRGRLWDPGSGGWFSSLGDDGESPDEKTCYTHAFVVLAASSGSIAQRAGAPELLGLALDIWNKYFWDSESGFYVDRWDRTFSTLDPYRGLNSNMHSVEALLAAADATGEMCWRERALGIVQRVVKVAREHNWRLPEHYDQQWQPLLEHNRDRPDDPFQPFGATVGHGLEWSRLILDLEASLGAAAPSWLAGAAGSLFDRAVIDGWSVDGATGFVYTTDWDGRPVVRDRMHWVVAEAISAGAAFYRRTGLDRYSELVDTWWRYAQAMVWDLAGGSWHHQLDAANRPISTVWPGKPDLYHAVQATLLPRLPLAPGIALALRDGLLEAT